MFKAFIAMVIQALFTFIYWILTAIVNWIIHLFGGFCLFSIVLQHLIE